MQPLVVADHNLCCQLTGFAVSNVVNTNPLGLINELECDSQRRQNQYPLVRVANDVFSNGDLL